MRFKALTWYLSDSLAVPLIEVKGPAQAAKSGWGQVHVYKKSLREHGASCICYIIGKGFPREIYDRDIGVYSYIIQDNMLALIPWRNASNE